MYRNILVPTDGSAISQKAVCGAAAFAKENGASVTALYAMAEPRVPYIVEGIRIDQSVIDQFTQLDKKEACDALDFVEKVCQDAGVSCTKVLVTSGVPYKAIVEAATKNGCDLIYMGSHGRSALGGLILGSVTSKVLSHSHIPVLVHR